jgi:hypothetical protein
LCSTNSSPQQPNKIALPRDLFEAFAGPEASIVNIFGLLRVDWRAARERTQACLDALCSYGDREAAAFDGRPGLTAAVARRQLAGAGSAHRAH